MTVDEELEEKMEIERIRALKDKETIMNNRKLQKEIETAEAEKR